MEQPSIRETNVTMNYHGKDIRTLLSSVEFIEYPSTSTYKRMNREHTRLRLIRTGRIRKIMKKI